MVKAPVRIVCGKKCPNVAVWQELFEQVGWDGMYFDTLPSPKLMMSSFLTAYESNKTISISARTWSLSTRLDSSQPHSFCTIIFWWGDMVHIIDIRFFKATSPSAFLNSSFPFQMLMKLMTKYQVLMPDTAGISFTTSFTSLIRVHELSEGWTSWSLSSPSASPFLLGHCFCQPLTEKRNHGVFLTHLSKDFPLVGSYSLPEEGSARRVKEPQGAMEAAHLHRFFAQVTTPICQLFSLAIICWHLHWHCT